MPLEASVTRHMKMPRRTKKAWRKRACGHRLSRSETSRVSVIDRQLAAPLLSRRLVATLFRVPTKLLPARPA